jgi:hypothetical protein
VTHRPLVKKLTYRDTTGRSQAEHAEIWRGFAWDAGPVIVAADGPWGTIKVWAASEAEGRRVVGFAATAGGWNITAPGIEWHVAIDSSGRSGRTGRMVTKTTPLGTEVTKRNGPSGFPTIG